MAKVDDIINSLTPSAIESITADYDAGMAAKKIIAKYNLPVTPNWLSRILPPIETDHPCPYCYKMMYVTRSRELHTFDPYCLQCGHRESKYCNCAKCTIKKRNQEAEKARLYLEKREKVTELWLEQGESISFWRLKSLYKVYVGLLFFATKIDNHQYTKLPISDPICPSQEGTEEMVLELLKSHVLSFDPNTPIRYFSGEKYEIIDWDLVEIKLNIVATDKESAKLREGEIPLSPTIKYTLWVSLAAQEVAQFFRYTMYKRKVVVPRKIPKYEFVEMVQEYSVSCCLCIITNVVEQVIPFSTEYRHSNQFVLERVLQEIKKYIEHAKRYMWKIGRFDWPRDLVRSYAHEYIYNRVLKIGDDCFSQIPTAEYFMSSCEYGDSIESGETEKEIKNKEV